MKWHWVRLQLRFEAPKDVKLEMLSRLTALSGNASLYLVATLSGLFIGLGPHLLENGSQPSLDGSSRNLHTRLVWRQG